MWVGQISQSAIECSQMLSGSAARKVKAQIHGSQWTGPSHPFSLFLDCFKSTPSRGTPPSTLAHTKTCHAHVTHTTYTTHTSHHLPTTHMPQTQPPTSHTTGMHATCTKHTTHITCTVHKHTYYTQQPLLPTLSAEVMNPPHSLRLSPGRGLSDMPQGISPLVSSRSPDGHFLSPDTCHMLPGSVMCLLNSNRR